MAAPDRKVISCIDEPSRFITAALKSMNLFNPLRRTQIVVESYSTFFDALHQRARIDKTDLLLVSAELTLGQGTPDEVSRIKEIRRNLGLRLLEEFRENHCQTPAIYLTMYPLESFELERLSGLNAAGIQIPFIVIPPALPWNLQQQIRRRLS